MEWCRCRRRAAASEQTLRMPGVQTLPPNTTLDIADDPSRLLFASHPPEGFSAELTGLQLAQPTTKPSFFGRCWPRPAASAQPVLTPVCASSPRLLSSPSAHCPQTTTRAVGSGKLHASQKAPQLYSPWAVHNGVAASPGVHTCKSQQRCRATGQEAGQAPSFKYTRPHRAADWRLMHNVDIDAVVRSRV